MALIDRSDLQYDYTWSSSPGKSPRSESVDKSSFFRRNEGDDVLALINEYASENKIRDKQEALRIERLIQEKLNEEERTKAEVRAWLKNNMK